MVGAELRGSVGVGLVGWVTSSESMEEAVDVETTTCRGCSHWVLGFVRGTALR